MFTMQGKGGPLAKRIYSLESGIAIRSTVHLSDERCPVGREERHLLADIPVHSAQHTYSYTDQRLSESDWKVTNVQFTYLQLSDHHRTPLHHPSTVGMLGKFAGYYKTGLQRLTSCLSSSVRVELEVKVN